MMSTPNQVPKSQTATPIMYQKSPTLEDERISSYKKTPISKYMECLKNHAASIGGNAKDGCGEFMPGGTEGTIEALKCSACNCHRNFHRKIYVQNNEIGTQSCPSAAGGPVILGHQLAMKPPEGGEDGILMRKRARTKFSQEQKEKMYSFAEKCGWKITKLDDSEVRGFCQEIGIKRKVLKVWMHNNKYHTAKKRNTQQEKDADEMLAL